MSKKERARASLIRWFALYQDEESGQWHNGRQADAMVPLDQALSELASIVEELIPKPIRMNEETAPKWLKPLEGESWQQAIRYEQGYNAALSDVRDQLSNRSKSDE